MGKAELSAMSNRFSSESICESLYGNATSHREASPLRVSTHTWPDLRPLHPPHKDPKHKVCPCKVPTSILRRRSNLISLSPELSHSQKSGRRVHFTDPEFTVYTYCAPGRPYLPVLSWLVLLLSVLLVLLLCTSWHQSQRPSEVLQAVMGKVVWGSWLWLTMQ